MSTFIIGDLQGCYSPLLRLLERIDYDDRRDTLWFVGDLVNRGPESIEALRFVRDLGERAITVLGNHDLHLLAAIHGVRKPAPRDTLDAILAAHDRDELEHFLRHQPLMHFSRGKSRNKGRRKKRDTVLVHAGIYPLWTLEQAQALARELAMLLPSDAFPYFLEDMYGNTPARWDDDLQGAERLRFAINAFTRMRMIDKRARLDFDYNGPPQLAPKGLMPWYALPERQAIDADIVFGHWSAHPAIAPAGIVPTDRGCVWGGSLVAYNVGKRRSLSVFNRD